MEELRHMTGEPFAPESANRRVLIIDGSISVHQEIRGILSPDAGVSALPYEIDAVCRGDEGLARVRKAARVERPYALVILEACLPAGWGGPETLERLWLADGKLEVALCGDSEDFDWEDLQERFGHNDQLLILSKPFRAPDLRQLACAVTQKWNAAASARARVEELRAVGDRAAEGSRAKTEFLATISHEIRTPLSGVLGMLELLRRSDLSVQQARFLNTATRSADLLRCLIDDFLDLSKIEAGKLELESLEFDLVQLVDDVVGQLEADASAKGIQLSGIVHPALGRVACGDPLRIRQVLINLVANAIKFTSEGGVVVRCAPDRETADAITLRFTVNDSGIGIPVDRLDRLFHPFSQIDGSTTRNYGGSGLGLAICNQLVTLMGGEIGVVSEEGNGSTFWFTLDTPKDVAASSLPQLRRSDMRGLHVVVSDPRDEVRSAVRSYFEARGVDVRVWTGGRETIEALEAAPPTDLLTVVFVGHQLADMDHEEFACEAKLASGLPDLVLVLLASEGVEEDARQLRDLGYSGQVVRPLEPNVFEALTTALACATSPSSEADDDSTLPASLRTARGAMRVLLVEDDDVNREVAESFLFSAGFLCGTAATGAEAMEAFKTGRYGLILMDCQMPGMDGYETTRRIRALERLQGRDPVPILALTANAMPGDKQRCLEAGMNDYIPKPVDPDQLVAVIARHLPAEKVETTPASSPSVPHDEKQGVSPIDVSQLRRRCLGLPHIVERVLNTFEEQAARQIAQLDGLLDEDDHARLGAVAHAIKGASANLAAEGVRDAAERLESSAREGLTDDLREQVDRLKAEIGRCLHAIPAIRETRPEPRPSSNPRRG
jgi:signal transduction histidine kinase/DNA-binding response OmpR family regulator